MKKSTWMLMAILGAVLVVAAAGPAMSRTGSVAVSGDLVKGGPVIGPACLPSTPISCSGLPIPVGGSCSCTAQLLPERCKSCSPEYKGHVLETTCTIRPRPCQPGQVCEIQALVTRTGLSCAP